MNTEQAIEMLSSERILYCSDTYKKELVELLQRGEKFEKMFGEVIRDANEDDDQGLLFKLDFIEQKYFPKPKKEGEPK